MPNGEPVNRILNRVDASRREFVKRVLAGAAFAAPVIASFSIESLSVDPAYGQTPSGNCGSPGPVVSNGSAGRCLADPGYVGPSLFQAHVADNSGYTLVNGEMGIAVHGDCRGADVSLLMTGDVALCSVTLTMNSVDVVDIELHSRGGFGDSDRFPMVGTIEASDVHLCNFDALLQAMASHKVTAVVDGTYSSEPFNACGKLAPASASPIIQTNG